MVSGRGMTMLKLLVLFISCHKPLGTHRIQCLDSLLRQEVENTGNEEEEVNNLERRLRDLIPDYGTDQPERNTVAELRKRFDRTDHM